MKPPKILDNRSNGSVYEELKTSIRKGSRLSVISAYFTIYAFSELRRELDKLDAMRFIFTEPTFVKDEIELTRQYYIDKNPERKLSGNEFEIKLRNELNQAHIARECAQWVRQKVEFKSLKRVNPAQQRLIHISSAHDEAVVIHGSVDFTTDGLGITHSNRLDMNTCLYDAAYSQSFLKMFDDIWADETLVEDVKQQVLEQMQVIYKENAPDFIYFVTLYNIFSQHLDELTEENIVKTRTGIKDTLVWQKLYKFQKDGVLGAINKIERFGGCVIADSVGLGKTFEALAIIKYYELRNDRVLVLCPKRIRENWSIYTQNDKRNIFVGDRFNFDVLNHTDLSRYNGYSGEINLATINWANYDLVVIDESHNFRNNDARTSKITRYARLMNEIIKAGVKTKVLMLSATPVNSRMTDIKNQIAFITEGNDDAFSGDGIDSIELTLRKTQQIFNQWSKLPDAERTTDAFIEMIGMDYFKLLDLITIARSRKHIEKYYNAAEIGKFPQRLKPNNIYAEIDLLGEFPPLALVNKTIKNLNMSAYSPLRYVLPEKRQQYNAKYDIKIKGGHSVFRQTDREQALTGLIRVGLLKRMESSIRSFMLTVETLIRRIDYFLNTIEEKQFDYDPALTIEALDIDDDNFEDLLIGSKVKVLLQDMDLVKWEQDLWDDREKLESLRVEAVKIDSGRDAKLDQLKTIIRDKVSHPINPENKKLLEFTAFADTAAYLCENLAAWLQAEYGLHAALVTGSGTNKTTLKALKHKDMNAILTNFSPRSKEREKVYPEIRADIDLLIATDCISEGQNLQDCDFLINYDIHWNPVRIIQRFGRIDRLGSVNQKIQLVNFWPNMKLDEYINLEARVTGRMVLLDISATGEENVIEFDENKPMNDLTYRKKQLQKLQEEVVDLEEISGGISITDLTLNDFRMDLMDYVKANRKKLDHAPLGMYAVVSRPDELKEQMSPGVIFALQQVNDKVMVEEQNTLYPYYLVYIGTDGRVKYNYLHAKKVLDYFKKCCAGQTEVLAEWVGQFNAETGDGRDMGPYSQLLETAIANIIGKKEEVGVASLFSRGGTTLQNDTFSGLEDFELISFLVIK
jgi:superfamily II DNA or RNA helicase